MTILFALLVYTVLIVYLQRKIWHAMPGIVFPLFTFILYYWTLAGSWLFTLDQLSGQSGKRIGLNYYYLLDKMFAVRIDNTYLLSISLYAIFILLFQLAILLGIRYFFKKASVAIVFPARVIQSNYFALFALTLTIASFVIVKDLIYYSLILNESVYINIRSTQIPHYTIHQYLNWTLIVSLFMYLGLYYRKDETFLIVRKPTVFFWCVFAICNLYLVMIGSRHETFFAGIIAGILFIYPHKKWKAVYKTVLFFGLLWMFILALNDPFRSLMPVIGQKTGLTALVSSQTNQRNAAIFRQDRTFLVHRSEKQSRELIRMAHSGDTSIVVAKDTVTLAKTLVLNRVSGKELIVEKDGKRIEIPNPHVTDVYQCIGTSQKVFKTIASIVFSNELFSGHFSMYGILSRDVSPQPGVSFNSLLYSFVPSFSGVERPLDSYGYYARKMSFTEGQGFTINHISSWYLNFGYFGLIIGPVFLAFMLLFPMHVFLYSRKTNRRFIAWIALCGTTAFAAMIIRSGPEAIKALLYEAILIPLFIVISAICWQRIQDKWFKRHE